MLYSDLHQNAQAAHSGVGSISWLVRRGHGRTTMCELYAKIIAESELLQPALNEIHKFCFQHWSRGRGTCGTGSGTSGSATHLQSLILNLVYRVACPLCHQVVLVRRLLMCWLHPQNWLAVRFLISWLTSKFVEIATPEMLWSGHVTNIDFTGIQICSNFLSSHERILEGSDPLHIND